MTRRRFVFTISISYEAPAEKIRKIPEIITEIIKKVKETNIESVHLKQLGDVSLVYEVAYTIKNPDLKTFLDAQQEINFQIMERFKKEKILFARVPIPQKP